MIISPWLAVAIGGGAGAVSRYWLQQMLAPLFGGLAAWSTLAINVSGAFLLGLALGLPMARGSALSLMITVGCLGGFTTFSTFAMDAVGLLRTGRLLPGLIYVAASVTLSLVAFALGARLSGATS